MKFISVSFLCLFTAAASFAQIKKHYPPAAKPKLPVVLLKTQNDSISYAAGMNQVDKLKNMHMVFSIAAVNMAIEDSLVRKKVLFDLKKAGKVLETLSKVKSNDTSYIEFVHAESPGDPVNITNHEDSVSYAFGLSVAGSLAGDYGIKRINYYMFETAIQEGLFNHQLLLTNLQARKVLANIYRPEYLSNLQASKKFMAENKSKPGVIALPDGLQYVVLKPGTGPNITLVDSVSAHYKGTLIGGKQFDSSYDRGQPLKLTDITKVISGWTEGLQLMNLGAKYRFFIPPNLGYGSRQRSDIIVPYSALIFDVEVVKIGDRSL